MIRKQWLPSLHSMRKCRSYIVKLYTFRASASFSTTSAISAYSETVFNLKIGQRTRVIFQGFTGRQATQDARQSLEYGTKIVGGVTPAKDGEHLGLPVLPNVRTAQELLGPDASVVYVAASQAAAAIEEAIEAEIPLVVAVAEHIPLHDLLRVHSVLRTQSKSRLVGANSPGMISAVGKCRLGFHPLPFFRPGSVGIVAKSGTLSYETVASTTRAGLGQSLVIGIGGDLLVGTNFVDALRVLEDHDDTRGIMIVGEIGGRAEQDAAEWIKDYRSRTEHPKPIMALVAGVQAPVGRVMGHAGAFVGAGERSAKSKVKVFEDSGVTIVNHPSQFGEGMKRLLIDQPKIIGHGSQIRSMHTLRRSTLLIRPSKFAHSRNVHISECQSNQMLANRRVSVSEDENPRSREYFLQITVDRATCTPCIITSYSIGGESPQIHAKSHALGLDMRVNGSTYSSIVAELNCSRDSYESLTRILTALVDIFFRKEASSLTVRLSRNASSKISVARSEFSFDDAAFRSSKRQEDIQAMRDVEREISEEVEAGKDGIVYIKLKGNGDIGTLVNGAGLAMNTVDAIADLGGKCANFLDTGGKATSETVKRSFEIILKDTDVRAIFVNIFGGLTLCDMIANGIMLAYKDLGVNVPVVVRLRGTNEEVGQKIIAESGLPLYAFDDFYEAVEKAMGLAGYRSRPKM